MRYDQLFDLKIVLHFQYRCAVIRNHTLSINTKIGFCGSFKKEKQNLIFFRRLLLTGF